MLCLNKDTNRVILTNSRLLAPSPVFSASKESRVIALMVYSTPLTVVKTHCKALEEHFSTEKCDEVGVIRISWEHDTFMLGVGFADFRSVSELILGGRYATTTIADGDLKKIKNAIEFQDHPPHPHTFATFDTNRFPGVNTYYYIQGTSEYVTIKRHILICCFIGFFDRIRGSSASKLIAGLKDLMVGPVRVSNGRKTLEKSSKSPEQITKG